MSSPPKILQNRLAGFLIWSSILSSSIFLSCSTFLLSPLSFSLFALSFSLFTLSHLLFAVAVSAISSPLPLPAASPLLISQSLLRFLFVNSETVSGSDLRRIRVSVGILVFVLVGGLVGSVGMVWVCGSVGNVGLRGLVFGLVYSVWFVWKKRWVLDFPIIQRPPYFSFKMGIPSAVKRAFKLSVMGYILSSVLLLFFPYEFEVPLTIGRFIVEQIIVFIGSFSLLLGWELSHHLHQVLHTKRLVFAPPKGSAAAETNPSEPLLEALEESMPNSLLQYLAYLDLCMVCENNVDTWRRAAFFEETGETYKRVAAVCLKPLQKLASDLSEGLEGSSADKVYRLDNQLRSPSDSQVDPKCYEQLNSFQQIAWCARSIASLTARSHQEDRFGVAQLTGCNAAVTSTLLSCLLAVEALMGKKTTLQNQNQLTGSAGIKWATVNTGRREVMSKKRGGPLHPKAYATADVLRTSIYCIVSAFHNEMLASAKSGLLEKDWITASKPHFGSRELLLQKLHLFLDFRAC